MYDKFCDILFIMFSFFNEKNNYYFLVDFVVKMLMNFNWDFFFEWLVNLMQLMLLGVIFYRCNCIQKVLYLMSFVVFGLVVIKLCKKFL